MGMKLFYKLCLFVMLVTQLSANDLNSTTDFTPNYSFVNLNINYLDWNKVSEREAEKGDYVYFGLEGGAGWDDLNFYGFANVENPTHDYNDNKPNNLRFSGLGDIDIEIAHNFKLHFQDFALNGDDFYVNDFVFGVGYKVDTDFGLWFRPFVGFHHTYSSYYNGMNGYMAGWLFNYDFTMFSYKFNIFQWHEMEFCRKKSFYLDDDNQPTGDGASWGVNGAISAWIYLGESLALGTQYRYARNKLGSNTLQSAFIYSMKYYF
jgi:hypothetical protein